MDIGALFRKKLNFFGLDIGQSSIKLAEVSFDNGTYTVEYLKYLKVSGDLFANQILTHSERFTEAFSIAQQDHSFDNKKAVIGIPGPSVFTKRIKIARPAPEEIASTIMFEAGNVLPQGNQGVKIDYHILSTSTSETLDVLLVAVRNEIIDSYIEAVGTAGLNVGIADVDFFALQNCFEINYPELVNSTVALIDVGHRFCSLSICKDGQNLTIGDTTISTTEVTGFAAELNRSLKFLWGSLSGDEKISKIILAGGNSALEGLKEAVEQKTNIPVEIIDPFRKISCSIPIEGPPAQYAIALGLAIRSFGDRIEIEEL
jgi:type IV pilus assembly protein PilM